MADSLRLKGTKHVINQTGEEFLLRRPKRGGDVHMVPKWWDMKRTVKYINCAIFDVQSSHGPLAMIIPADAEATDISIIHDGDANFVFPIHRCVDRVAIMAPDLSVFYEEYQFAKISGGPVLRRTVNTLPDGIPGGDSVVFSSDTAVSGTPEVDQVLTATPAAFSGGIGTTTVTLQWQGRDPETGGFLWNDLAAQTSGPYTYTPDVSVLGWQIRAVTKVVDDTGTAANSSDPTSLVVNSLANRIADATETYVVTVGQLTVGETTSNIYELNGVGRPAISLEVGESAYFDQSDASNSTHPLRIYTDETKTTEVTVGVETVADGLLFTPVIAGEFSYQCANHANMGQLITVNSASTAQASSGY